MVENHEISASDDAAEPDRSPRKGKKKMTTNTEFETPRAELAHLLDTCGGNPARWPPRVRARIAALATTAPEAQGMLARARAFDRLLDTAIEVPAHISPARAAALADRIMATAVADPGCRLRARGPG